MLSPVLRCLNKITHLYLKTLVLFKNIKVSFTPFFFSLVKKNFLYNSLLDDRWRKSKTIAPSNFITLLTVWENKVVRENNILTAYLFLFEVKTFIT